MGGRGKDLLDVVLFSGGLSGDPSAAPVLCLVCIDPLTLDVSEVCEGNNDVLFLDQRLVVDVVEGTVYDLG